jgi:hypothetical protein
MMFWRGGDEDGDRMRRKREVGVFRDQWIKESNLKENRNRTLRIGEKRGE